MSNLRVPKPKASAGTKPTLAVDFDGVVHDYSKGWQGGSLEEGPMPGCADALRMLSPRYRLVLFTARHDLEAVRSWLVEHHLNQFFADVTNRKPAAAVYLDDRALKFTSWPKALSDLL